MGEKLLEEGCSWQWRLQYYVPCYSHLRWRKVVTMNIVVVVPGTHGRRLHALPFSSTVLIFRGFGVPPWAGIKKKSWTQNSNVDRNAAHITAISGVDVVASCNVQGGIRVLGVVATIPVGMMFANSCRFVVSSFSLDWMSALISAGRPSGV